MTDVPRYHFSGDEVKWCRAKAERREETARTRAINQRWTRTTTRSGIDLMMVGVMAEFAAFRYWSQPIESIHDGPDSGWDLEVSGLKVNVRGRVTVRGGGAPDLVLNIRRGKSECCKADAFVLVWTRRDDRGRPVADLLGWQASDWILNRIERLTATEVGDWRSWIIPRRELLPVSCLVEHAGQFGTWEDVARACGLM